MSLPPFPVAPFGLLLVEGGDERTVCEKVAGAATWAGLACWYGSGSSDLARIAALARLDPSFSFCRSVGVVLDAEEDAVQALALAEKVLAVFGATGGARHGGIAGGSLRLGVFISPDGASAGSIESLCRRAVRNPALATCVDQLVTCAGGPNAAQARADKGWLNAYLGMTRDPGLRFYQAFAAPDGIDPGHAAFDDLRAFLRAL